MAGGEYLVCFSEKCEKEDVKQHIIDCLTLAKFSVSREEFEGKTLLTVGVPFETLAQKVRVMVGFSTCPLPMQGSNHLLGNVFLSCFVLKTILFYKLFFRRRKLVWRKPQGLKTRYVLVIMVRIKLIDY